MIADAADANRHPFWQFSLRAYARPGVAAACLGLQESRGADVNVVLLTVWLASQGRRLDAATLDRVRAVSRRWQADVVGPVRAARRAAKAMAPGLYAQLKATELACEQAEQLALAALVADLPTAAVTASDRVQLATAGLRACLLAAPHVAEVTDEEAGWLTALAAVAGTLFVTPTDAAGRPPSA